MRRRMHQNPFILSTGIPAPDERRCVTDKEKRSMRIALGIVVAVVGICGAAYADEATTAGKDFWKVFVHADMAALKEQYADEIVLKAGSEFLKKEWGINDSETGPRKRRCRGMT